MAGHSKWANIRFRKNAQDSRRSKIFTKLIREITVASRIGGPDISSNPRLRDAISKALKANMKRDTIDNAVARGSGNAQDSRYDDIRYEGYGPGGVAFIIDCLSDNRNRTVGEVRHILTKFGGNLGTEGSVAYLFKHQGILSFPNTVNESKLLDCAIVDGVQDMIVNEDGTVDVIIAPNLLDFVKEYLVKQGFEPSMAEKTMIANVEIPLEQEMADTIIKLIDALEDLDDVQNVYSNAKFPDDMIQN